MNGQQDLARPTGGRRDWNLGSSGLGPWLDLAGEVLRLPFRMLGLGLQLFASTGEGVQRLVAGGTGDRTSAAGRPAGLAPTSGYEPPRPAPVWASPLPPPIPGTGTGSVASSAGAVANLAETTNREEKDMSCDKDLSGTDLKIVEYTIVTVDPDIEDDDLRIIQPMQTVATTEDMNENGFIAWVVALYFQKPDHRPLTPKEKQYLRVCYCVECRMPIPEVDCCQEQANALRDINRTLKRIGGLGPYGQGGSTGLTKPSGKGGIEKGA